MKECPLIVLGSARKESDTLRLVKKLFSGHAIEVADLLDYSLAPYSYSAEYPAGDQFTELVERMLYHRQIIFATPVYWYAMSAGMKILFDRLTDLVTINKPAGRRIKGKQVFLVATGSDSALPEGFEVPFQLTSSYFEMEWVAQYYEQTDRIGKPLPDEAEAFLAYFK